MVVLAQDLRDAVLQYALQGKLTEQLDSDSSVEELLKNKKLEIENILFEIPNNWKWSHLDNISTITMGSSPKGEKLVDYRSDYFEFHQGKTFYGDRFIKKSDKSVEVATKIAKANSILLSVRAPVGAINLTDRELCIGRGLASIENDKMNQTYLEYCLIYLKDYLNKLAKGSTFTAITKEVVCTSPIPVPPIEEQARIVTKVEEIMQKIDEYEKIEKQLEEIKKAFPMDMRDALLQAAMQGKLTEQLDTDSSVDDLIEQIKSERQKLEAEGKIKKSKGKKSQQNDYFADLTEDEQPFEIPSTWKFVNLNSVSYTNGGYAFKSTNYTSEGIRVIRISDFNNNGILNEEIVRYAYEKALEPFKIKQNDILMCMTGGTVGKCCIVENLIEDMATNQRVANISSLVINPKFLYLAIKSPFIQKIIQNNKTSTNDNISMDLILSFPIPLPPLEEQERIVKVLNDLLPLCEAL